MAIDTPSNVNFNKRKRGKPLTKMELKKSLVMKRLDMLKDNSDDDDDVPLSVRVVQNTRQNPIKKECVNELLSEDDALVPLSALILQNRRQSPIKESGSELLNEDNAPTNSPPSKPELSESTRLLKFESKDSPVDETYVPLRDVEVSHNATKRKRSMKNDSEKTNSSAMKRAKEIQAGLSAELPSFTKLMSRSHVVQGFWLGIPKKFTDNHLPGDDCEMTLVDEDGKKCKTNYLAHKSGLSGGWRTFAITRDLREGDVCVFHLMSRTTFKVYIVREGNSCEANGENFGIVDGAIALLKTSEDHTEKILLAGNIQHETDVESGCEVVDGIRLCEAAISFEEMKEFEKFNIIIDDLVIDSKFTIHVRKKYHELCCSQGGFLHEKLLKGLNCNLVVGIISEVVNIADAIKAREKSCASYDDLCVWGQTLKGFEALGMNVSFLCKRINNIMAVVSESDAIDESRFTQVRFEKAEAANRLRAIEVKLGDLKDTMKKVYSEVEAEIKASARKQERVREIANAPW